MKKITPIVFLALIPVLIVVGYLMLAHINKARAVRTKALMIEKLKADIANELPKGTEKDEIFAFLTSHQMEHSEVIKWTAVDANPKHALLISASVPLEVKSHSRKDLVFSFYLDEAGTLQDLAITESKGAD